MLLIPKNGTWNQRNDSDVLGSLWASFNIDLSENEGRLRVGKKLISNTTTPGNADLTSYAVGFKFFLQSSKVLWTVAGSLVFVQAENYPSGTGFIKDPTASSPTDCDSTLSDIEVFNGELYVSRDDTAVSYQTAGGSWTTVAAFGNGASPTPLCVYQNRLYSVNSGTNILSINTSHTVATIGNAYTTTLPFAGQIITFMKAVSDGIWIGVVDYTGGPGYVYKWDGTSTQVNKSYKLEAQGALSCVIKNDIPYIIDSNGNLLQFNGGTFVKLDGLNRYNKKMLYNALGTNNSRFIHPNGMAIVNGKINMLIDGRNYDSSTASSDTLLEVIPSGIYEYDPEKGLVHKHSVSTNGVGDIIDYGAAKVSGVGALAEWNTPSTASGRNGTLICGANYYLDATTTKAGIFYDDSNDTLQKAGSFITTKYSSTDSRGFPTVQNIWNSISTSYRKLLTSTDKIIVKYRVFQSEPVEATITWASTTSFTVLNSAVVVSNYWSSGTGGEVEIVSGIGAGKCSHITNAVNVAGTWTVTVDETYMSASGTAKARFQLWKKLQTITYNNAQEAGVTFEDTTIGIASNWIQFKVFMLFTGRDELEQILVQNNNHNPI